MSGQLVAAAPVLVPEAGFLVVGLAVFTAWLVLYGTKQGYDYSLGYLLRQLASLISGIPLVGGISAKQVLKIDHYILDALAEGIEQTESVMGKFWHAQAWLVGQLSHTLQTFAHDVETAIAGLVTVTIPNTAGAIAKPLRGELADAQRALRALVNDELRRFARGIDSLRVDVAGEALARVRGIDQLGAVVRARIDGLADELRGDVAAVDRYARGVLDRRLTSLERRLSMGVLGGVALYALTRAFPYWQCTNVRSLNRMVCRAPVGALDDLLGLALVIVGSLSIRELAHELQAVVGPAADAVNEWIVEN